ncbi:aspartate--tRNA ligase, mitochondrial-like isoform X1 [Lycorma delicatula]|uniref:aspartate--tRNA ligase, mitochondrial-like isoform X1 n=2 Tax=Lycorma delicatula TaxID=130591 RepID=UPI003F512BFC
MLQIDAQISSELLTNLTKDFKVAGVNKCCIRTHTCGELRGSDVGKHIRLCGWLQFQRMNKFATIRDSYGTTQLIIPDHLIDIVEVLVKTPIESTISVKGVVCTRPVDQVNPKMLTGEIEVTVVEFEVLNPAKPNLPFLIRDHNKAKEHLRLKHRYLDLRFPQMQRNLRLRSKFIMQMRDFLINHREFVEVETPTLFRRTPGVKYTGTVKSNYESLVTKRYPGTRFTPIKVNSQWQTVFKKVLPMVSPEKLKEKLNFDVEDLVFIAIGKEEYVLPLLGKLRLDFAPEKADLEKKFDFLWVIDFPLFLSIDEGGVKKGMESAHHPFTQPHPSDAHLLKSDPLKSYGM